MQPPWCRLVEPLISVHLRICRAPSAPDVEGVAVWSSRVHSRSNYVSLNSSFFKSWLNSQAHFYLMLINRMLLDGQMNLGLNVFCL